MTQINLRPVQLDDRHDILDVEKKSTPRLQYLPYVYELFLNDPQGEFTVAEIDGQIVACAKFSVLPDGSGWLETIRVDPKYQGLGVGKRFYENYALIAKRSGVAATRMYTGINNAVSAGLAARYGHSLAETFYGFSCDLGGEQPSTKAKTDETGRFSAVSDPDQAVELIMPHANDWGNYLVMNRTFYQLTPILCRDLAQRGFVFHDGDGSTVVVGARFMPDAALHLGFFTGPADVCLDFAAAHARSRHIPQIQCLFPIGSTGVKAALEAAAEYGHRYTEAPAQFIVMEAAV